MALKSYNPVTPSQRQLVLVDRSGLYRGKPVKELTEGQKSTGGRNNLGRTTMRYRGGGHKKAYRKIDFKRRKFDVPAKVERIEYDPNRTGFIALIRYEDGELAYILAPQRLAQGDTVVSGEHVDVKPGNAMPVLGWHLCADRGPRRRIRHLAPQLLRAAPGAWPLHGDDRRSVESRQHEHFNRQGRPDALDGLARPRSRRGDESGRPSARRPYPGRTASGDAVGC